jgi:signal transduction histidine kinase
VARSRAWFSVHPQRLAYSLIAVAMAGTIGATAVSGVLLHRSAALERQTLRTQGLASAAFGLQNVLAQAQIEGRQVDPAAHARALRTVESAFRRVRRYDSGEGGRLALAYAAYLRASARAFSGMTTADQRQAEARLGDLESRINGEVDRLSHSTRVTNPHARLALILAVAAAGLLVALLIWQFELQRRAGRIDRDYAQRSEELVRMRDEFVASVSHELRTPLTSIMGYVDLLKENVSEDWPKEQLEFLAVVDRNAHRLLQLVSDLLLVAELESRTLALDVHEVDLAALANECIETAKPAADAKDVSLTIVDGAPASLEGDPVRLAQMMDNLVSNAIKFTPAGGRVTVTTADLDGHAVFEVSDTGAGMSAADRARAFDRFYRAPAASAQAAPGTGLGLAITKAIVDAHHGSIHVDSTVGAGTTIRVQLPHTRRRDD